MTRRLRTHGVRPGERDAAIRDGVKVVWSACGLVMLNLGSISPALEAMDCKRCRATVIEILATMDAPEIVEFSGYKRKVDPQWKDPTADAALGTVPRPPMVDVARGKDLAAMARFDFSGVVLECECLSSGRPVERVDDITVEGRGMRLALCGMCCWAYDLGSPVNLTTGVSIFRDE